MVALALGWRNCSTLEDHCDYYIELDREDCHCTQMNREDCLCIQLDMED